VAKDLSTWATKYTAPVAGTPLTPLADDGLVLRGNDGLVFLDGDGTLTATTPITGQEVTAHRQGEWRAITVTGNLETVSSATIPVEARSHFAWPGGNKLQQRQAQVGCGFSIPFVPDWRSLAPGLPVTYDFVAPWSANAFPAAVVEAFGKWTTADVTTGLNILFSGPQASPMLIMHTGDLPPKNGKPVAGGIPNESVHINQNGFIQSAVIFFSIDTSILSSYEGFHVVALHEIGHLHGLDDTSGKLGESVMNQGDGKNDSSMFVSRAVTTCDRKAAFDAPTRQWP